ncbi:MAG: hypothetical protein WD851_13320 [Pirellulales bacterium]
MRANQIMSVLALTVLAVASVQSAVGQQPTRPPAAQGGANDGEMKIVAYDVGDLVMDVTDYPYPGSDFGASPSPPIVIGGGGGMGGGGFGGGGQFQVGGGGGGMGLGDSAVSSSSAGTPIRMDDLITVLVATVAPDTWVVNGRGDADVKAFGNSIIVRQTSAVHRQIEQLLQQLRAGSGERKSVSIDARWLLLTSDELDQLMAADEAGNATLSRERLAEFTRRPASIRGQTNCFSGQLVYVVSGTKRNIVSGYIPVVGSLDDGSEAAQLASLSGGAKVRFVADVTFKPDAQRNVGYQPIVEKPNVGALLEIRPTLVRDSNTAIVDLKATVTGSATAAPTVSPAPGPPEIDRVAIQSQVLATTLRVPLGEPVLVGGLTYAPTEARAAQPEGEPTGEAPQLYLVLEVR